METIVDNNHLKVEAYEVWLETDEWQQINHFMTDARGFVSMMFEMIEKIEHVTMSKIAMMLWTIWWRRNKKCWQDRSPTIFEVKRRAKENLQDWLKVQQQKNMSCRNIAPEDYKWTKPSRGMIKCNIDSACYMEQNIYSVGACIRNEQGQFVQAYAKRSAGCPNIAEAEAMGLLEVLRWLKSTNRTSTPIVIETDCMQVAKAILAKPVNKTEFGSIIELCLRILAEFDNCKVSFVRRQANRVAHELAQATRILASPQVYNLVFSN
ncbi:uncharacterized protein LOC123920841 [Trifolium pratense]|uniref:uncharacterized protein LOC123920841 n=1 Tax=Trifolium pratense TaxID=57577 RepID=UPI001E690B56|nr:uncharacterized protein LOC123920841 [Trifolium pratense]